MSINLVIANDVNSPKNIYELKAVFITKFANFIDWYKDPLITDPNVPFTITILGDDPFDGKLQQIYDDAEINLLGKKIQVKTIDNINQLDYTSILFISESENKNLSDITNYVKTKPILTISDTPQFAENGIHINFYIRENNTLHFEINEQSLKESPLVVSVRLLAIAKIVGQNNE